MIAQFALRLMTGMSLFWALMPRREVTSGFFRIQMLVTLGLSVLAALTGATASPAADGGASVSFPDLTVWFSAAAAVVSFVGSVLWTLDRRRGGSVCGFLVLFLSAAALGHTALFQAPAAIGAQLLFPAAEFSSAALLGGLLTTMLLGHWYLTAPTMSIAPLSRLNLLLGCCALLRGLFSAVALARGKSLLTTQVQWLWLGLRWGTGIFGPLVVVLLVHRILKYRNTQSATGVLFVGVILSFIGELSAMLLTAEFFTHPHRLPF